MSQGSNIFFLISFSSDFSSTRFSTKKLLLGNRTLGKNKMQPVIFIVSVISANRLVVDNDSIRYPGRMLGLMGLHHLLGDLDLVGLGKTRGFFI